MMVFTYRGGKCDLLFHPAVRRNSHPQIHLPPWGEALSLLTAPFSSAGSAERKRHIFTKPNHTELHQGQKAKQVQD